MSDYLTERDLSLSIRPDSPTLMGDIETKANRQLLPGEVPVRFAVTNSMTGQWLCDVGIHVGSNLYGSIFEFSKRTQENTDSFNVVMLVPTGIGAEIGGHAGDATPTAALLSSVCDSLITHPNVFNASDMIQIPPNALYVEGSVITRLIMGTARLMPTRGNRILVLIEDHEDQLFVDAAVNAVNASRAYYGLQAIEVMTIDPRFKMIAEFRPSGTAAGRVEGLDYIWKLLDARIGSFDGVAISSVIEVPHRYHQDYYEQRGKMVNPWGGVEAMLTHAISSKYGIPSAHAPMFESREVAELELGVVDPRMAAEVVSVTFLQSVLRGLQSSPKIFSERTSRSGSIGAENISCLVIPFGCLGLPTLAALHQGIPTIAVRENSNIMHNDLEHLPWKEGQFFTVENYWEAVGVIAALRTGTDPYSARRPLSEVNVTSDESRMIGVQQVR